MDLSYIMVSSASNSDESLDSYNDEEYDCDADQEYTSSSVASSDCSSVGDPEDPTRVVYYKPDKTSLPILSKAMNEQNPLIINF